MDQQQQTRWRRVGRQVLWAVGVLVAVSAVVFVVNHFFVHRPLWDWLKLLVVPAVIAAGGLWFNQQQRDRELEIANNRAEDETLRAYLDGMSDLLADNDRPLHRAWSGDSLSSVARARTLTVLPSLNSFRKASVVQFLYEAGLIFRKRPVLDLRGANLYGADLSNANLSGADLSGADLRSAHLSEGWFLVDTGPDLRDDVVLGTPNVGGLPEGRHPAQGRPEECLPEWCHPVQRQPE
jgi:Pentapeptide repeats (8 copies)